MKLLAKGLYAKPTWQWILAPFMLLFAFITTVRRWLYSVGIFKTYKSHLPVIVVGNITVGGTGKTPVVLALIEHYLDAGIKPVLLSRGYGGSLNEFPYQMRSNDSASVVGDEPAMIKNRADIPIVIDPIRSRGVKHIENAIDADVVICDDGLQHYALGRDFEFCIMDERGVGNGFLLPLGPLRENVGRLDSVSMILINGTSKPDCLNSVNVTAEEFSLTPSEFINVKTKQKLSLSEAVEYFTEKEPFAMAGIGNPERFFASLLAVGIKQFERISLPDHHPFSKSDIVNGKAIIMTEKDAIKCREIAHNDCWFLQVDAELGSQTFQTLQKELSL